jgi:hypothetical protein
MFMVIFTGSYAAQYYTWSVGYQIVPLFEIKVVVNIGAHSGATSVPTVYYGGSEMNPAATVSIPSGKTLNIYTFIPHSALDALENHFYSIRLTVYWKKSTAGLGEYNSKSIWLVYNGVHHYVRPEPNIGLDGVGPNMNAIVSPTISSAVGPETWYFWFTVDGIWTGAVQTSTGPASFPIWVYAVEV